MVLINLLPWRQRLAQKQRRRSLCQLGAIVACGLFGVGFWGAHVQREIADYSLNLQQVELEIAKNRETLRQRQQLQQQGEALQKGLARQQSRGNQFQHWHRFWQALPERIPDKAWIHRAELRDQRLLLEGFVHEVAAVRQLQNNLAADPLVIRTQQAGIERQPSGVWRFRFSLHTASEPANG
ncbi:PilN domain-containing protein [Pantoea sp. A4]|uniref:PilN domain-containing protein n=1 Tax=Pantoea sp. A4 TaxID=1225184 RepID=UPI000361F401|nr:PilN domain-containing protein [Pantoea sp. A4]